jgi:hypothetical protein
VRIHNLASHTDEYIYFNPEARYISNARIDQLTVIWDEYAGQYPDDTQRVLAARRFEHQFYMPLVFR